MKRNLITKKELEYVQKYLPAMGPFTMRTDGGVWVDKIDRHEAEVTVEISDGEYEYLYIDEKTTINDLKLHASVRRIKWRREIEE